MDEGDKEVAIIDPVEDEDGGFSVSGEVSKKEIAESEVVRVEDDVGISQNKFDDGKSKVENEDGSSDDGEASSSEESLSDQEDQVTKIEGCAFIVTASSKDISSDLLMSSPGNCAVNVDMERNSSSASLNIQTVTVTSWFPTSEMERESCAI
ncbi:hypothetical protein U1Q18_014553 [Sarracenia purpurea var. burkii]